MMKYYVEWGTSIQVDMGGSILFGAVFNDTWNGGGGQSILVESMLIMIFSLYISERACRLFGGH